MRIALRAGPFFVPAFCEHRNGPALRPTVAPVLAPQSFPSRAEARSAAFRGNYGHHGVPRLLWWTWDSPLPPRYAGQKNTPPGWGTRRGCSVRTEEKGKRAYVLTSVEGLRERRFSRRRQTTDDRDIEFSTGGAVPLVPENHNRGEVFG